MNILLFLLNVVALAVPISLLEIALEKDKGWGASFPKNSWYGKTVGQRSKVMQRLARLIGIPYFFGYTILMYFLLVPAILTLEYFFFIHDVVFLVAVFIGNLFIEDFLWFVFNPYFSAFRELLKGPHGSIWWHGQWIKIGSETYLPASYLKGSLIVGVLIVYSYLR